MSKWSTTMGNMLTTSRTLTFRQYQFSQRIMSVHTPTIRILRGWYYILDSFPVYTGRNYLPSRIIIVVSLTGIPAFIASLLILTVFRRVAPRIRVSATIAQMRDTTITILEYERHNQGESCHDDIHLLGQVNTG